MAKDYGNKHKIKKPVSPTVRPSTTMLFVLRALQLGIKFEELDYFTVGEIYDLITESGNDREEWDRKATQEDIKALFG